MSQERIEYDADNQIVKVYPSLPNAKTLVPAAELQRWTQVVKAGQDDQGRPVRAVRYVFEDKAAATYNQQPVAFAGLETYLSEGGQETPLGDDPSFSTREDFGINEE